MVFKVSKSGVYSGNTLRASNSLYNRRYRSHCSIVRVVVEQFNLSFQPRKTHLGQLVDEFDITASDVEFSLNKRKRWVLPAAIQKRILHDSVYDEGEMKMDLLVKHKLKRQSNCVAFYSNMGILRRLVPRRGRYFDGRSVTMSRTQTVKTSEQTTSGEIKAKDVPAESSVRYEVYVPCSSFSSIVHNPKYIRPEGRRVHVKRGKHKRRWRINSREIDEMLEFCDPQCDDDGEPMLASDELVEEHHNGQFLLEDCLKPKQKRKRKSRRKVHRHCDESCLTFPRVVHSKIRENDNMEEWSVGRSGFVSVREATVMTSVAVKIATADVRSANLQTMFAHLYNEARCQPRRFTIDITDKVRVLVKTKMFTDIPSSSLDLQCFLVFREEEHCPVDVRFDIYNVNLNFSSHAPSLMLETVNEMDTYTISELETRSLDYIRTLPRELFVKRNASDRYNEPPMNFELVGKSQKWKVRCILPEESLDLTLTSISGEGVEKGPPSQICNICYDVIRRYISPDILVKPATSLATCGHWFCDSCWTKHLANGLASGGATVLACPEHGCSTAVDFHTSLSFMHISAIKKHLQRIESEKINASSHALWCPIPNCGRAILVEDDGCARESRMPPRCAVCKCGVDVCLSCLLNAHWPASCRQARQFRDKVIALKDYVHMPKDLFRVPFPDAVVVDGKSCPRCKMFIEKISGCKNMACPCGFQFCWNCTGETQSAYVEHQCVPKARTQVLLEEYASKPNDMKRTRHYDTALAHRQQRQYSNYCVFRSRACALVKRLSVMAVSSKKIQKQVRDIHPRTDGLTVPMKVNKFIMRMLSVKMELHHVIENTSVVMDCMLSKSTRIKLLSNVVHLEYCVKGIEYYLNSLNVKQGLETVLLHLYNIHVLAERSVNNIAGLVEQG